MNAPEPEPVLWYGSATAGTNAPSGWMTPSEARAAARLCSWCGDPVYGDRTAHDCCAANKTAHCPACAASKKAEREWMRVSRVCVVCRVRCRFSFGDTCPRCVERLHEEQLEARAFAEALSPERGSDE